MDNYQQDEVEQQHINQKVAQVNIDDRMAIIEDRKKALKDKEFKGRQTSIRLEREQLDKSKIEFAREEQRLSENERDLEKRENDLIFAEESCMRNQTSLESEMRAATKFKEDSSKLVWKNMGKERDLRIKTERLDREREELRIKTERLNRDRQEFEEEKRITIDTLQGEYEEAIVDFDV